MILVSLKRGENGLLENITFSNSESCQGLGTLTEGVLGGGFGALYEVWRLPASCLSIGKIQSGYQKKALDPLPPLTALPPKSESLRPLRSSEKLIFHMEMLHHLRTPLCHVQSCWDWSLRREGITGLLKKSKGTQSESSQGSGTPAEVLQEAKIEEFRFFEQASFREVWSR